MENRKPVVGLVCSAAGGVEGVRTGYVEPAVARGWQVAITLTPTAATWLSGNGETDRLAALTGLPVRSERRRPGEPRPHPYVDCWVVAPATGNTIATLALGLTPNQAVTSVCEALADPAVPVVIHPRVNPPLGNHPAYAAHLSTLRATGAVLVPGPREIPWAALVSATADALRGGAVS